MKKFNVLTLSLMLSMIIGSGLFGRPLSDEETIQLEEIEMLMDSGNVAALQEMLRDGKLSSTEEYFGKTLLMRAAENRNIPMVHALIQAKSDVNAQDYHGLTPLLYALRSRFIIQDSKNKQEVAQVEEHSRKKGISTKEAEIKMLRESTPMARDVIGIISAYEPNIFIPDRGQREVVRLLLDAGAQPDLAETYGTTPLMEAAGNDDPEIVKMLLEKKVDVNQKNEAKSTALLRTHSEDVVQLLLDAGADINAQDFLGNTLLMNVIQYYYPPDRLDLMRLLLNRRANISLKNQEGHTVIDIIRSEEHPEELFRLLRNFYPNIAESELEKLAAAEKMRAEEEDKKKHSVEEKKKKNNAPDTEEAAVSLDDVE